MVKFQKQLERQMVPEWRFKYCNYEALKKDLEFLHKEIDKMQEGVPIDKSDSYTRSTIELQNLKKHPGLLQRLASHKQLAPFNIMVNVIGSDEGVNVYKSRMLSCLTRSGAEKVAAAEAAFFGRVDRQMNKIEGFYADQERQCTQRANSLYRQLEALLEMKNALKLQEKNSIQSLQEEGAQEEVKVLQEQEVCVKSFVRTYSTKCSFDRGEEKDREERKGEEEEGEESCDEDNIASSDPHPLDTEPHNFETLPTTIPVQHTSVPSLSENEGAEIDPLSDTDLELRHAEEGVRKETGFESPEHTMSFPKQISVNIPALTPADTIMRLSRVLWEDGMGNNRGGGEGEGGIQLSISRTKVTQAEKMLRGAFMDFYKGASMLQSYSAMNTIAISKIMKKHDKIAGWSASQVYLPVLELSYFHTSQKVMAMMSSTETLFVRHFGGGNQKREGGGGMQSLRPTHRHPTHNTTFFLGLSLGLSLALLVCFAAIMMTEGGYSHAGGDAYLSSVFPVWAALALLLLHLYLYGLNIWAWRKHGVNYTFIFEFGPESGLMHRQVLLLCGGLTCVLMGGMVLHLLLQAKTFYEHHGSEWVPFGTVVLFFVLLINPCRLMYRPARYTFLRSLGHCLLAPLYKVYLADFFLGDQMTSQVPFLRYLEYMCCYFSGSYFLTRSNAFCNESSAVKDFAFVIAMLPYWIRLMQCLRRYIDERDQVQLYNAAKYLSAMTTVALKVAYLQHHSTMWFVLFAISALGSAIFQIFWDLVYDWGLLRRGASRPWLRDNRVLRTAWVYYVAMVVNVVLRFAWLQSITGLQLGSLDRNLTDFIFAAMEVVRRGQWNFFRLENEHLNNVGKFRAVKTVPLPFRDSEGEEL